MSYSHDSEQFYVPSRHLGLIIGKGGSRIKELSEEFNCRINIKKDDARDDEVPITFEGDPSDIRRAKEKIKDITKRNVKRHFDDDNNDRNYGRDRDRDNGHKRQSRREDSGDNWGRKSDNKRDDSDEYNSGKQNNSRKYDHYDRNERRDDRRDDRRNDNRNGGYSNQKRVTNDSDDWGAWGEKKVEENTVDTLTFGDEPVMSFSKYLPPSSDNYIPDDDWGIPNFFDDQKPVRSRPSNADCKMRARKDKAMYPILRNFYREHPSVARMSSEERDAFLKAKNNIMIKEVSSEDNQTFCNFGTLEADDETCEDNVEIIQVPKIVPNPIRTFEEAFYDHPDIMREIHKQKFQDPSPIQCIAWPVLMSGRDFIGIAQTGTGKTLAFLLPAFFHIEGQRKPRENRIGPTVLILSPTRELAIQIQNEVQKYTYHDIDSVVCYGGSDKREQIYQLKDNPEIVVGTPGRIQDLKDSGVLNLKDVSYLVLDEADRMLDMGFEIQVVNLIYAVRKHRQTIMTSATWPFSVQRIALTHMQDPVQVNVGTLDLNACHSVSQYVEYINEDDKMDRLCDILSAIEPDDKIIIFVGKKAKCRDLAYDLLIKRSNGKLGPKGACRACEIHGDLDQQEREIALRMMRSGARNVMIATDVASRGLDICDLTKVINYDFPKNIEEYVHRVGRTGRAGRTGESFTFMSNFDSKHAAELIRILEDANQEVPSFLPDLMRQHQDYRINGGGGGFRNGRGGGGGFRGRGGGRGGGGRFNRYDNDGPAPRYDDSRYFNKPKLSEAKLDDDFW